MRFHLTLCVVMLLTAACGGFQVTSTRNDGVPAALLGSWEGAWQSDGSRGGGSITVQVQEFEEEPIVSVQLDNPCIAPQRYQLLFVAGGFELRADGDTVLRAEFTPEGRLAGEYTCDLDSGTWSAVREGDLPGILDLSGSWNGQVEAGGFTEDLVMEISQSVGGGEVRLLATVQVPTYMALPLPLIGRASFRENEFDVLFTTTNGVLPAIQMVGVGDRETMTIRDGVMVVSGGVVLPFSTASWQIAPAVPAEPR
ncbi:MAG: hypothetical protein NXI31_03775 [bacterium]|nr:hypothetical protein [bacterium]